jgi:hypothetical protein
MLWKTVSPDTMAPMRHSSLSNDTPAQFLSIAQQVLDRQAADPACPQALPAGVHIGCEKPARRKSGPENSDAA